MTGKVQHAWGAAVLWAALAGGPAAAQELRLAQPNAARFPEVTLYAYPTDARGLVVPNLAAGEFQVTENGKPAVVVRVKTEGGALEACLALDRSRSMEIEGKFEFARAAAGEFIRQLGGQDRAAVVTFGERCSLDQPLTGDRAALAGALARARPSGNGTAFLDGVYWAIRQVALQPQSGSVLSAAGARAEARRVVLALTDGRDNASHTAVQQLIELARAHGVSICTIALGTDAAAHDMLYLAQQTGGVFLRAPQPRDLQQLYATLARQLRQEYRITIRSPRPEPDASRRTVRVTAASLPAAEAWYQAPGQGSLLVVTPGGGLSGPGAVAAGADGTQVSGGLLVGALVLALGLAAGLVALFFWLGGRRERRLRVADSNPRLDLLPLWVRDGSTRVGRGAECDLVLDSHEISRVHARIESAAGVYTVVDEGSSNGTFVNGRRVQRPRRLEVGDVVRFGDREFRFAGMLPG